MSRNGTAVLALSLLTFALLAAGCASTQTMAPSEEAPAYPSWVSIAVPERDGRSQFVGGVSFAENLAAGLEEAEADARSQIHNQAVHSFTDAFNNSVQGCGVEMTPLERQSIKNSVTQPYGERMSVLGRLDLQYDRPCGGEAGGNDDGPVCEVFVLMTVGLEEWNAVLTEVLENEMRRRSEEGEANLVEFLECMIRELRGEPVEHRRDTMQ